MDIFEIFNTLPHCPGGVQNFHRVHPGKQNFHWGSPRSGGKENFHWGAHQSTEIRNCHCGANLTIKIFLGFTPVSHRGGKVRKFIGVGMITQNPIEVYPAAPRCTPMVNPGWGSDGGCILVIKFRLIFLR